MEVERFVLQSKAIFALSKPTADDVSMKKNTQNWILECLSKSEGRGIFQGGKNELSRIIIFGIARLAAAPSCLCLFAICHH